MMSEEDTRYEEDSSTHKKSPTPDSLPSPTQPRVNVSNDQTDIRTVVCSNPEMAKIAEKLGSIKNWSVNKLKTSKQAVLENLGKVEKTIDTDMEQRVAALNDLHGRYREILIASGAYLTYFNGLNGAQKALAESFYQLSLREEDLKEVLTDRNETLRNFATLGDDFSRQLTFFVSSIETLCNKTIKDTLMTVQVYENARLEFDAHRNELALLQDNARKEELQRKCDSLKQKYEQLKEDVRVKLALLDENRLKVMKNQLSQFETGLHQYLAESIKTLSQSPPKTEDNDSNFIRGVRGSSSFLEQ